MSRSKAGRLGDVVRLIIAESDGSDAAEEEEAAAAEKPADPFEQGKLGHGGFFTTRRD